MKDNITEWNVEVSPALGGAVEESLRQVRGLYRRKQLRRAGVTVGSAAVLFGAFLAFGFTNPALASQIPVLGGLFQKVGVNSKISLGNENVAGYGVVEEIGAQATDAEGSCTLTVAEGYCDGNRVQLVLALETPQSFREQYGALEAGEQTENTLLLDGEKAPVTIGPFLLRDGQWLAFAEAELPEALAENETVSARLTVGDLSTPDLVTEPVPIEDGDGKMLMPPPIDLNSSFAVDFQVKIDHGTEYGFSCEAQDNGARLTGVSGTPIQTVLSIEKPYWGDMSPVPEDGGQGVPVLLTMDGKSVQQMSMKSLEEGGYDRALREPQTGDLYFDGLPAGTKQAVLRFYKDAWEKNEVLAEFTIDFTTQTAAPSATYREGGVLDLNNPYRYEMLQNGEPGQAENGIAVIHVGFRRWDGYTGTVFLSVPEQLPEAGYRVQLNDSKGNVLLTQDCVGEPPADGHWSLKTLEFSPDGAKTTMTQLAVDQPITGIEVPIGETVTTTVTDLATGKTLLTESRVLETAQR